MNLFDKLKNIEELAEIRKQCAEKGKKIVWTSGCFDLLHKGHKDYLEKAKKLGGCLIVGVNSDASVGALKGEGRPVYNERTRAWGLLDFADFIIVFDELSPMNCLEKLKPDIYVKGGDYDIEKINQDERKLVESYGGEIVIIPKVYDISTTRIIEEIRVAELEH